MIYWHNLGRNRRSFMAGVLYSVGEQMKNDDLLLEQKNDKIFELNQEIIRLRRQVTYLQEELSSVEDEMLRKSEKYENKIAHLEQELGDALSIN